MIIMLGSDTLLWRACRLRHKVFKKRMAQCGWMKIKVKIKATERL